MALDMDFAKLSPVAVFDLAVAAEQEAEENYDALAVAMDREGRPDAAQFFRTMSGREKLHREQLETLRTARFGDAPRELEHRFPWGIEVAAVSAPKGSMNVRTAIAAALAAEVRAYEYYDGALAAVDGETAALFTQLRDAELEHQRMLRREAERVEG